MAWSVKLGNDARILRSRSRPERPCPRQNGCRWLPLKRALLSRAIRCRPSPPLRRRRRWMHSAVPLGLRPATS
ncbi:Uncharacterised protein [Bordetella pertussis]|nr:Uncharacterised protein [Bordetella pertussis]